MLTVRVSEVNRERVLTLYALRLPHPSLRGVRSTSSRHCEEFVFIRRNENETNDVAISLDALRLTLYALRLAHPSLREVRFIVVF
jgi:hypothetical protein